MKAILKISGAGMIAFFVVHFIFSQLYAAIEVSRPLLFVFSPFLFATPLVFLVIGFFVKTPTRESFVTGLIFGMAVSLGIWASNYFIHEPIGQEYKILNMTQGRGGSVNWLISTRDENEVLLNVHIEDPDVKNVDASIKLNLHRGWLGFYFGNRQ